MSDIVKTNNIVTFTRSLDRQALGEINPSLSISMNKHTDATLPHCEAMPDFRFLEWRLDDVRRQADDVRREKYKAACKRFDRHRKAWLTGYSLFSFGELADVYVSRMPIDEDRDQGRKKFFELLRASIAAGEFERGGRPRISVISPDKIYRLPAEFMEAGDGDAMQALLEQCWTLPAIGIEWCGRLEIELPSRWKDWNLVKLKVIKGSHS